MDKIAVLYTELEKEITDDDDDEMMMILMTNKAFINHLVMP